MIPILPPLHLRWWQAHLLSMHLWLRALRLRSARWQRQVSSSRRASENMPPCKNRPSFLAQVCLEWSRQKSHGVQGRGNDCFEANACLPPGLVTCPRSGCSPASARTARLEAPRRVSTQNARSCHIQSHQERKAHCKSCTCRKQCQRLPRSEAWWMTLSECEARRRSQAARQRGACVRAGLKRRSQQQWMFRALARANHPPQILCAWLQCRPGASGALHRRTRACARRSAVFWIGLTSST